MPKLKIEEAGSLSKYERQELQRLYTQGAAAYGSLRNLAKASRLPVSKVRLFYIQRILIQNLLWQHENSKEWGLLLDSETKFGAWILLTLINWQRE